MDLRERVVRAVERRVRPASAAKCEVSVSSVVKLMPRWRQRGTVEPDQYGGWKRSPLAAHTDRGLALVAGRPEVTLEALRCRPAARGIRTSRSALARFLRQQGLTRKTRASTPPSRTARTALRARRVA